MTIEQLEAVEHVAYLNYAAIKDDCARRVQEASKQWSDARKALAQAQKASELAALREAIRKEIEQEKSVKEPATSQPAF